MLGDQFISVILTLLLPGVTNDILPHADIVLSASNIKELKMIEINDRGLKVGAMVTMAQLQDFVKAQVASLTGRYLLCIYR